MDINIEVCRKEDLARLGFSDKQIFDRIVEIDSNNGLNEEVSGNEQRLMDVFNASAFMWRAIVSDKKIIGYWNCVPLNDKYLDRIKKGRLRERDVHIKNINKKLLEKPCEILFDSVCIDKPYQGIKISGIIIKSIYDAFVLLPQKRIYVTKVWASVWSEEGIKFFSKLGFDFFVRNKFHGNIYKAEYKNMMQKLKNLIEEYRL